MSRFQAFSHARRAAGLPPHSTCRAQVIPRGSNALVTHIKQNTKIPVMGHADGICHIYIDQDADLDLACKIVVDAKTDYPAACNAVEKVLVHSSLLGQIYKIQVRLLSSFLDPFSGRSSPNWLRQSPLCTGCTPAWP